MSVSGNKSAIYKNLPEEEKTRLKHIVYILDKFGVSIESYHELRQLTGDMPKTYLVEECQKDLNAEWEIRRTPGDSPGAELPIRQLLQEEIKKHVRIWISGYECII